MSKAKVKSVRCKNCGAPLSLHGGGHKIRSLTCEFCGSVMDARQDYKLLAAFNNKKPATAGPLELGMEAKLKGVDFTIIGLVVWAAGGEHWTDYQLFSPTHGYAWLSYDRGHWVFSYRTRELPDAELTNLETKQKFAVNERKYAFYDQYQASISYVAGELTWVAQVRKRTKIVESCAPPYGFSMEYNAKEREFYQEEYLEATDVRTAFGLESSYKPYGVHALQPFKAGFIYKLGLASWPFIILSLVAILVVSVIGRGSLVFNEKFNASELTQGAVQSETFTISRPQHLVLLEMDTNLHNAWAVFDIQVQKAGQTIFGLEREISYYSGTDSDGSWSEGSHSAKAKFLVPEAGEYQLTISKPAGGEGAFGTTPPSTNLRVWVREGYIANTYFYWLFILTAVLGGLAWLRRRSFETKRWKPVTEDDD